MKEKIYKVIILFIIVFSCWYGDAYPDGSVQTVEYLELHAITYRYDICVNFLSIRTSIIYTYDDNGNRLTKGSANYTYNSLNQLTQVSGLVAGTVTYKYDGQGRRVEKYTDATIRYYYDGANPTAQANEGDKLLRSYT